MLKYFWEKLDKEGWSLWFCDYKYNDELDVMFKTLNLLGGYIQRSDACRKYAFGSLLIFGEEPKLSISGCWLFRGQEVPQVVKDVDDTEHYNWTRVNVDSEDDKKKVNEFWLWQGDFGGKKFSGQAKVFK